MANGEKKKRPKPYVVGILELAKCGIQEDIRRCREVGILEQINCMRSENPPIDNILQGGSENTSIFK